MIERLQGYFAWNHWANRETLASLERAGQPPPRALALLAHLVGTEHLWHARLQGEKSRLAVWPDLALAACREEIAKLEGIWRGALGELTPDGLGRKVSYVNSKGESWESGVEDILMHVVFHGSYHRGQIAKLMREGGFEPAYTDYIHAVRQGLVPGA
ncbi:MAG: DinB family protein [Thermoanaerobaculia bacterium]